MIFASLFEVSLEHGLILGWLAIIFGFYMAWNIGANDVANAMGTSVGSGALTLGMAVLIAGVMELTGAVLVGSHVTDTVRKEIFDPSGFEPAELACSFLAALLAAAVWLQTATWFGWPVSTTHSIVGSIVGVGILIGGVDIIQWRQVTSIALSWITSPLCGGIVAFALFRFLQRKIIDSKHPLRETYRWTPYLVAYVGFILTLVMVWKGLSNLKLNLSLGMALIVALVSAAICFFIARLLIVRLRGAHAEERKRRNIELPEDLEEGIPFTPKRASAEELRPPLVEGSELPTKRWEHRREFEFEKFEGVFASMMILSACFLAFAHGANDVANAIGPLAGVLEIVRTGSVELQAAVPLWILILGGVGIVVGLATWGYRVMETIGKKITQLTPSRGFAVNVGAATTIVLASRFGFPISTTHTLVGAVLGVGLARGIDALNLRVVRDIVISWLITIPAGAIFAVAFYYLLTVAIL